MFVAVIAVPCDDSCSCYFNQTSRANVFDCSHAKLDHLPTRAQNETDWIFLQHNTVMKLCQSIRFDDNVTFLNLSSNSMEEVCPEFIRSLSLKKMLRQLDLSENRLQYLPQNMQEAKHLTKIWLTGNPFVCDCTMLWMIDWIANFTLPSTEHVVQNYHNITCTNGVMAGQPIYTLNRVDMGCFPDRMPSWEIALLAVVGFLVIAIAVSIVFLFKKREKLKFLLLRDKDEKLDGKEFDVLISYR